MLTQAEADQLTESLLAALADNKFYQAQAIDWYTKLINYNQHWLFNWTTINKAIIEKWSKSGLIRIKTAAWDLTKVRSDMDCPECGAYLLLDNAGIEWCSDPNCTYSDDGIWED